MKYNELTSLKTKSTKRVGRGIAAGRGKTAGRGTKGQKSRAGYSKKPGFEGGQNPLMQKLPKLHGFRSFRTKSEVVYTGQLETIGKSKVDNYVLADANLVSSPFVVTKLIYKGEISKKLEIKLQQASKKAIEEIGKKGGTFETIEQIRRPKTTKKAVKETKLEKS